MQTQIQTQNNINISYKFEPFFQLQRYPRKDYRQQFKNIRYVILVGGRGSGKSHALAVWLNRASYIKGWGFLVTRWTMKSAERSIIPEFKDKWTALGNENDFIAIRSIITNVRSGNIIDFKGIKPQSGKSSDALKSIAGKNVLIVEEAQELADYEMFDKIDNSIRVKTHKNLIVLCLNPAHTDHWIYKEFFKSGRNDVMILTTTYRDNIKYLSDSYLKKIERDKERNYARYEHIYLDKWTEDTAGALWQHKDIDENRITREDYNDLTIKQTVIAYDPGITNYTGNESNIPDEDGIIVQSKCINDHYYIIRDETCHGKRSDIAKKLVELYYKYDANCIIIEKNNGGDWIPSLIKVVDPLVRIFTVSATKGKILRAQPIQALYEEGFVHHVGYYPELEYEMTTYIENTNQKSPNRLDANVWGLTHLSNKRKQLKIYTA